MFNFFAHVNYSDMITFNQWRTIKKWAKTSVQFGFEVFALFTFLSEWFAGIYIGSEMNCHFIRYIWNEFCVFYIPEPLAKGYKTHNECHKYRMKWNFITDSFYHMFNPRKREKNRGFFLPILLRKTRQCRDVTYDVIDELRRFSLSSLNASRRYVIN